MSQFSWESDVAVEAQAEQQPSQPQEPQPEPQSQEQAAEPGTLALSVDDFSALEDRILRAVTLVKSERQARASADERVAIVEAQLQEQVPMVEHLQTEVNTLRAEREQVRQRVERLLAQLDALEL